MTLEPNLYSSVAFAAAGVSLVTAIVAWSRRKRTPGGWQFALLMLSVVIWSATSAAEAGAADLSARLILSKLGYLGIAGVAPWFLEFALAYGRRETRLGPMGRVVLWSFPAATLVIVATNEQHHLIWTSFSWMTGAQGRILLYHHGPWYWVWVAYYGIVSLLALMVLVPAAFQYRKIYVWQTAVLLAGAALPWAGEALYLAQVTPFRGLDLTAIGFGAMGVLVLMGMSRFSLFTIVPVARTILVERMSEGVVVLDAQGCLVDANPAALALLQSDGVKLGAPCGESFPALKDLLASIPAGESERRAHLHVETSPQLILDLVITELRDPHGHFTGRLVVLRDVTVREKLLQELQGALADVKTLRGLLPICSSCKKIRDDDGYWQTLEHYIQEHSEARFSHGLCGDCIEKLYPELVAQE